MWVAPTDVHFSPLPVVPRIKPVLVPCKVAASVPKGCTCVIRLFI